MYKWSLDHDRYHDHYSVQMIITLFQVERYIYASIWSSLAAEIYEASPDLIHRTRVAIGKIIQSHN